MAFPSVTPSGLTFTRQTSPTRYLDSWTQKFAITPQDTFSGTTPATLYNTMISTGATTVAYGSGSCVFSGASAGKIIYQGKTTAVAPYCWSQITISALSGTAQPQCGFAQDANNYLWVYYDGAGNLTFDGKLAGNKVLVGTVAYTPVLPFTLRFAMAYPDCQIWVTDINGTNQFKWHSTYTAWVFASNYTTGQYVIDTTNQTGYTANGTLNNNQTAPHLDPANWTASTGTQMGTQDLRLLTNFPGNWAPVWGANRNAGDSCTITNFACGYNGGVSLRDFHNVTDMYGQPWRVGSKIYFTATLGDGPQYRSNSGSVLSVDIANGYALALETLLFFKVSQANPTSQVAAADSCTALYSGVIKRDTINNQWILMPGGWGVGDSSTGVSPWYATTKADLMNTAGATQHVLVLPAYNLNLPTSASLYDNDAYFDGTNWNIACTETNTPQNWSSESARIFSGTTLQTMSAGATDTTSTRHVEGVSYIRVGGQMYITGIGSSTTPPIYWTSSLTFVGSLASTVDFSGTSLSFANQYSHFPVVGLSRPDGTTQYLALLFDSSTVSGSGMLAAGFVETSQIVAGQEWPGNFLAGNPTQAALNLCSP